MVATKSSKGLEKSRAHCASGYMVSSLFRIFFTSEEEGIGKRLFEGREFKQMVSQSQLISVAVLAPVDRPLTYSVSPELDEKVRPGLRVLVPLGRRKAV